MSKDGEFFICSSLLGLIVTKTIILITIKAFKDIKLSINDHGGDGGGD